MDKEKKALNEFLGEFSDEIEKNPFEDENEDPFTKEEETAEESAVEEKEEKLPYHQDPKLQKYLDKREKEIESRIRESLGKETEKFTQETKSEDTEVKSVLEELIGNDTPQKVAMVKKFEGILLKGTERAKEEALKEIESRRQEEINQDIEADNELESAFEAIEEGYKVDITSNNPLAKKTRQEFISYVEKIAPKDRNGDIKDYPDMGAAWEEFQEKKKATQQPNRAKELASRSMTRSSEVVQAKPVKRLQWDDADELIDGLFK